MKREDFWMAAYLLCLSGSASSAEPGYADVARNAREQADRAVQDYDAKFPGGVD